MNCRSIDEQAVKSEDTTDVPAAIRCAACAFIACGVVMLSYGKVLQILNGWLDAGDYSPKVIGALGMAVISLGILHRARWAWWLGIGLALFALVGGGFAAVMLFALRPAEWDALMTPRGSFLILGVTIALLSTIVILLLLPRSRAAFSRR